MIYGALFFALLIYAPQFYVRLVMWRHSKEMPNMPGTGGELAQQLVERFALEGVRVEEGAREANFYSPDQKLVSLSPDVYRGKSLTAVAIAAHEVGHAIQFVRDEPVSHLRKKYMRRAIALKRLGAGVLALLPVVTIVVKAPQVLLFGAVVGVLTMLVSALMYIAILPEEYDASFGKALPILAEGYVPKEYLPAIRQVLRAAALTYLAGALADVIRLWRWMRGMR